MLDFSGKKALVVGGSSGIGNGIAQAFRARGAAVTVWGTRASAADYDGGEGSDLSGLTYARVDASNRDDVDRETALISSLDVLVLCQGTVRYNREEFERPGWDAVMEVNITSVMDVARGLKATLAADGGGRRPKPDQCQSRGRVSRYDRDAGLCGCQTRSCWPDQDSRRRLGTRWNSRKRACAGPCRDEADACHNKEREAPRRRFAQYPSGAYGHPRRYGRGGHVPCFAASELCDRPDHHC